MKIEYDGNFRERWKKRRELAVAIIATVAAGECIETEFERLKAASCYDRLSQQDQASFRRFVQIYELSGMAGLGFGLTSERRF